MNEIFKAMSLCHCTKTKIDKSKQNVSMYFNYEDKFLIDFAKNYEHEFEALLISDSLTAMTAKINGKLHNFPIIGVNEFHKKRNRFSIVLLDRENNNYILYLKGRDESMIDLFSLEELKKKKLKLILETAKTNGMHTVFYGKKYLNEREAENYFQKYNILKTSLTTNENDYETFYNEIERNSVLLAVVCLEDKIKKGFFVNMSIFHNIF